MSEQYLSIKDFAESANVSIQSVYKRIKKSDDIIQPFIKIKDGKKVIAAAAIEKIYNSDYNNYDEIEEEEKPLQDNSVIELLKEQIEQQRKELEIKNNQIADLSQQLKESSERETNYQHLLNQQQQLTAADKQKILQLESAAEKKKKGFFSRFKKKDNKEE